MDNQTPQTPEEAERHDASLAPAPMAHIPITAPPSLDTGILPDKVACMVSYLLVPAAAWLVLEPYKHKPNIRFHAWQSLLLFTCLITIHFVFSFLIGISSLFVDFLWALHGIDFAIAVVAIVAMVKINNGEAFVIPVLGPLAQQQSDK